uniref:Two-component response regulator-like PRR95 n=1 Tax=Nicotiana sylvestris TaxID=4096 RepID=A0A1U7XGC2_NICSY|nr:PREDICTED: two-component response regulator-like PRR95 [Nicotiana sylvestris]
MGEAVMMSEGGGGGDGQCLKKMVLRVLLVEADDATRQIIAALLRKCSYRGNSMEDIISRSSCTRRFLVLLLFPMV